MMLKKNCTHFFRPVFVSNYSATVECVSCRCRDFMPLRVWLEIMQVQTAREEEATRRENHIPHG